MSSLVGLNTAKSWLPHLVESLGPSAPGMTDEDLQRYIDAATTTAERVAGRHLAARDYAETYDGEGRRVLLLYRYPVQSVTSVKISTSGDFDAVSAEASDSYEVEPARGALIRRGSWARGYRSIKVEYRAGYELSTTAGADHYVPDDLTRAVCEVIDWMYQRDRNQTIGIRTTIGADGLQTSYALDVPLSARSVFESYREVRV
jgi:uncharacterized phiE125 gp8 family phage protein